MQKFEAYVRAFYDVTQNPLDHYDEIKAFDRIVAQTPHLLDAMTLSETTSDELLEVLGKDFSDSFVRFLNVMREDNMLFQWSRVLTIYQTFLIDQGMLYLVEVSSAKALEPKMRDTLETQLKETISQEMEFKYQVEPALLAGMIVKINNELIDVSLKGSLDHVMKGVKV